MAGPSAVLLGELELKVWPRTQQDPRDSISIRPCISRPRRIRHTCLMNLDSTIPRRLCWRLAAAPKAETALDGLCRSLWEEASSSCIPAVKLSCQAPTGTLTGRRKPLPRHGTGKARSSPAEGPLSGSTRRLQRGVPATHVSDGLKCEIYVRLSPGFEAPRALELSSGRYASVRLST